MYLTNSQAMGKVVLQIFGEQSLGFVQSPCLALNLT